MADIQISQSLKVFDDQSTFYNNLKDKVDNFSEKLKDKGIRHFWQSRVKTAQSLQGKLQKRKEKGQSVNLTDILDLVGGRIILFKSGDLEVVEVMLRREFDFKEKIHHPTSGEYNISPGQSAPRFRIYDASHFRLSLKGGNEEAMNTVFEIQVMDIIMWTFYDIEHDIVYKGNKPISKELRQALEILQGSSNMLAAVRQQFEAVLEDQHQDVTSQPDAGNGLSQSFRQDIQILEGALVTNQAVVDPETHKALERVLQKILGALAEKRYEPSDVVEALFEYYSTLDRLTIERISGDPLPMDQCYLNLAIVERSKEGDTYKQKSPFSLLDRLKLHDVATNALVTLHTLFNRRRLPTGETITPKRILIQGDAGIGKTTLCKKIVYDYIYYDMWKQSFDYLLWVPLRQLKGKVESTYNFQTLCHQIFFSTSLYGDALARTLADLIDGPNSTAEDPRVLFILDGLDEVSDEIISEENICIGSFIKTLLLKPNVIITSRPHRFNRAYLGTLHLELETIGFNQDQVAKYMDNRKIVKELETAEQIRAFLAKNPLMQGLVRIPIQLDALCCTWNGELFPEDTPKTMTTIYHAIVNKLWQKDILRLKKKDQGQLLNANTIKDFTTQSQIEIIMQLENELLQGFAFIGLYNNVIEFNATHRSQIHGYLREQNRSLPLSYSSIFKSLSFLRTSDNNLPESKQNYHFLHLTFQEFFAAQYFVRQWTEKGKLFCLTLVKPEPETMDPRDFLRRFKYQSRYNIFWRFVAGLIQSTGNKALLDFFELVEAEPRDLLGPTHQRMITNCLCEWPISNRTDSDALKSFRSNIENKLYSWLLFECNFTDSFSLCSQNEIPKHLLKRLLEEKDDKTKVYALKALQMRSSVMSDVLDMIATIAPTSEILKAELIKTLGYHSKFISKKGIEAILSALQDQDIVIRYAAADALGMQSSLPSEILTSLVLCLQDQEESVRSAAADALGMQSSLSSEILTNLMSCLQDQEESVRQAVKSTISDPYKPRIMPTGSREIREVRRRLCHRHAVKSTIRDPYEPHVVPTGSRGIREVRRCSCPTQAVKSTTRDPYEPRIMPTGSRQICQVRRG
ncbi:hypothetical protein BP6252_10747 [Coleophoma cylindrospora]|uniref:NACHT domain-containing protein n=1 Tax=Coleophoma cylindrospora TaxID=1849047 RepID=A0A3D8QTD6_9HELO|nr:hypothetical protein BP6252_10747 [Coleophoma cylindrospora]